MATTTINLGLSLDGLSNVDTAGKANGDILRWNSTTNKWEDSKDINFGTNDLTLNRLIGRIDLTGATTSERFEVVNSSNLFCLRVLGDRSVVAGGSITAAAGSLIAWNGTAVVNANDLTFFNTLTTARIRANATTTNIALRIGTTDYFWIETTGSVVLGNKAALATNATDGFTYIPTCAGVPTGTPTAVTGKAAMVADTTGNKLYVYLGGAWVAMN